MLGFELAHGNFFHTLTTVISFFHFLPHGFSFFHTVMITAWITVQADVLDNQEVVAGGHQKHLIASQPIHQLVQTNPHSD